KRAARRRMGLSPGLVRRASPQPIGSFAPPRAFGFGRLDGDVNDPAGIGWRADEPLQPVQGRRDVQATRSHGAGPRRPGYGARHGRARAGSGVAAEPAESRASRSSATDRRDAGLAVRSVSRGPR